VAPPADALAASGDEPEEQQQQQQQQQQQLDLEQPKPKRQRVPIPVPPQPQPQPSAAAVLPAAEPAEAVLKPNSEFLGRFLTSLGRGNERKAANGASKAGLQALGQAAQAAARPVLQLAESKGQEAVGRAALEAAEQARLAACVGTLTEVARTFGFKLTILPGAEAQPAEDAQAAAESGASEEQQQQQQQEQLPDPGEPGALPLVLLAARLRRRQEGDDAIEGGKAAQERRGGTSRWGSGVLAGRGWQAMVARKVLILGLQS
jgi:hypothetical protein